MWTHKNNSNEILFKIPTFPFLENQFKMSSAKCRPLWSALKFVWNSRKTTRTITTSVFILLLVDSYLYSNNPLCITHWGRDKMAAIFPDDNFKYIFMNENVRISLKISLNFASRVRINNIPALFLIMAWRHSGDKPLSESMMVRLPTHICITRPQWDNHIIALSLYTNKSFVRK